LLFSFSYAKSSRPRGYSKHTGISLSRWWRTRVTIKSKTQCRAGSRVATRRPLPPKAPNAKGKMTRCITRSADTAIGAKLSTQTAHLKRNLSVETRLAQAAKKLGRPRLVPALSVAQVMWTALVTVHKSEARLACLPTACSYCDTVLSRSQLCLSGSFVFGTELMAGCIGGRRHPFTIARISTVVIARVSPKLALDGGRTHAFATQQ
jgi:hypothetical protein